MVDIAVTPAQVQPTDGQPTMTRIAGEDIDAGETMYLNATDDKWYLGDADDTEAKAAVKAIALNTGAAGQAVEGQTDGPCTVGAGAALTVGEIYVQSGTPGKIAPEGDLASSDYVTVLGVGKTASVLDLNIHVSGVQVP